MGWCALAWSERGIVRGWLPSESEAVVRGSMARRCPEAIEQEPPAFAAVALAGV